MRINVGWTKICYELTWKEYCNEIHKDSPIWWSLSFDQKNFNKGCKDLFNLSKQYATYFKNELFFTVRYIYDQFSEKLHSTLVIVRVTHLWALES